jgi:hypothetical protein
MIATPVVALLVAVLVPALAQEDIVQTRMRCES